MKLIDIIDIIIFIFGVKNERRYFWGGSIFPPARFLPPKLNPQSLHLSSAYRYHFPTLFLFHYWFCPSSLPFFPFLSFLSCENPEFCSVTSPFLTYFSMYFYRFGSSIFSTIFLCSCSDLSQSCGSLHSSHSHGSLNFHHPTKSYSLPLKEPQTDYIPSIPLYQNLMNTISQ